MNCDDAFERLTDPARQTDARLEAHLAECPRCRHMRETLAPALSWLRDEAASPWEAYGSSTPGPCLLTEQALQIAEQAARTLPRSRSWARIARSVALLTMVALGGMGLGAMAVEQRPADHAPTLSSTARLLNACLWSTPDLRTQLADRSTRGVVVSCVMCHVPSTVQQ